MDRENKHDERGADHTTTRPSNAYSEFFIGNLPRGVTERDVVKFFSPFGPVLHFNMCRNAEGRPRGYGWLRFSRDVPDLLDRALYQMQQNTLTVEVAQVRTCGKRNPSQLTAPHRVHANRSEHNPCDRSSSSNISSNHPLVGGKHARSDTERCGGDKDNLTGYDHTRGATLRSHRDKTEHRSSHHTHHISTTTTNTNNNNNNNNSGSHGSSNNRKDNYSKKDHNDTNHDSRSHRGNHRRVARSRVSNPSAHSSHSVSSRSVSSHSVSSRSSTSSPSSASSRSSARSRISRRSYRNHRRSGAVAGARRDAANGADGNPSNNNYSHASDTRDGKFVSNSHINNHSSDGTSRNMAKHSFPPGAMPTHATGADAGAIAGHDSERMWPPPPPPPQSAPRNSSSMSHAVSHTVTPPPTAPSSSDLFVCLPMSLCPAQFMCDPRVFTARLDLHRVGALTICGSIMQPPPPPPPTSLSRTAPVPYVPSMPPPPPPPPQQQHSFHPSTIRQHNNHNRDSHNHNTNVNNNMLSNVAASVHLAPPPPPPTIDESHTARAPAYATSSMHSSAADRMTMTHGVSLLEPPPPAGMLSVPPPPVSRHA